ncbi:MAG: type III pantothenate kinase [Ignavibacteriaceae bacterium]|nr:type III pantothenate kinase [Ignavibacteriaceae bacterium]
MLLTIDIGNTNIKSAFFENSLMKEFNVHTNTGKALEYFSKHKFEEAAICSVNPAVEKLISDNICSKGISTFRISVENKFNLKIKYRTPATLGMDRVCSVAGALDIAEKEKLLSIGQYLITIDFGTATTINILSPDREFIGGLIAPGITTMLKSLNEKTANLPLPDLNNYKGLIGDSTSTSIISGVITATTGLINETIGKLSSENNEQLPVIFATGGNAGFIIPHLKYKVIFEEALVLKGLKVLYDLNN